MYTCLILGDNSTLAVRAKMKAGKAHLMSPHVMPCLLDSLEPDLLASYLKEAAEAMKAESDIWMVSLPLSLLSWQCASVPLGHLPKAEEVEDWMLKYLPAACEKSAYTAYIAMTRESFDVTYVSAAFLRKDLLDRLIAAFRLANLDLYVVEPEVTATARYLKHVHNMEQTAFLSTSNSLILMTDFGLITAKDVHSFKHLSIIESYAKSKIPECADAQFSYCTLSREFEREFEENRLPVLDLSINNPFTSDSSLRDYPLLLPVCGMLLKKIKRKEPFAVAIQKLFGAGNAVTKPDTSQ